MSDDGPTSARRRFLKLTGITTLIGLAGCAGGGGGGDGDSGGGDGGGGDGGDGGQGLGPVPEEYETATSIGGMQRDPDNLQTKEALSYQSSPKNGQQCSDCTYYIEDQDGDGLGACAIVEGKIEPSGWCASFAPVE